MPEKRANRSKHVIHRVYEYEYVFGATLAFVIGTSWSRYKLMLAIGFVRKTAIRPERKASSSPASVPSWSDFTTNSFTECLFGSETLYTTITPTCF